MRYFIAILIVLIIAVLFIQSRLIQTNLEQPVFLKVDEIAANHQSIINTTIHSFYKPDSLQILTLTNDYKAIWSHLNYMYSTGDIKKGKDYYTQDWFKVLSNEYKSEIETKVKRVDSCHNIHIINWSFDGLVCNIIDSNVFVKTSFNDRFIDSSKHNFAFALLFQGDHWRVEGFKELFK